MLIKSPPLFLIQVVWILSSILLLLIVYYLINIGNNYIPEKKRIRLNIKKVLPIIVVLLSLYIFRNILKGYPILSDTFFTVILSIILAYIFNPLVNKLENKGLKRMYAVLLIYLIIVGVLFIIAFLVIPRSSREIRRLVVNLPIYFQSISEFIDNMYRKYYSTLGDLPPMFQGLENVVVQNIAKIEDVIMSTLTAFVSGVIGAFSKIISVILTPILTLYFLVDKEFFIERAKKAIPRKYKKDVLLLANKIDKSLILFVRGRLIMALSVGLATTVALLIMGIDFALVIGFITGVADVIPYIGPFLGFVPAVLFAYASSPIKAVWVIIFFLLIQWLENNVLGPKILGETIGLHPLIVLLSIIIGGALFGVAGMIFSVPIVGIGRILFAFIKDKLKKPPQ